MSGSDEVKVVTLETKESATRLGQPVVIEIGDRRMTANPVKVSMFTMIMIQDNPFDRMQMIMKLLDSSLDPDDVSWLKDQLFDNDSEIDMVTFSDIYSELLGAFSQRPTSSQSS